MRFYFLIICCGLGLLSKTLKAQGFLYDPIAAAKLPKAPLSYGEKFSNLPKRVDLSPFTPVAMHQVGETCVAFSTVTALTMQKAIETNDQALINNPALITRYLSLSPIYPLLRAGMRCTSEQRLDTIAKLIAKSGTPWFRDFPKLICDVEWPKKVIPLRLIEQPQGVFVRETENKVSLTKAALASRLPVIVGLFIGEDLKKYHAGQDIYRPDSTSKRIRHAVVIVGYDNDYSYDNGRQKGAFKMFNCYGPSWGKNGFFWMTYEDFKRSAEQAIVLAMPKESDNLVKNQQKLGGLFRFIHQTKTGADTIRPQYVEGGLYKLSREDWHVEDEFQLYTKNTHSGEHLCVFSISLDGEIKTNTHYPRPKQMSTSGKYGAEETDLMPISQFGMLIPDSDTNLEITEVTTDYLCVLYSINPISHELPAILERIRQTPGDIIHRIHMALGSRLIKHTVQYRHDDMDVTATFQEGDTVPIILAVKSVKK